MQIILIFPGILIFVGAALAGFFPGIFSMLFMIFRTGQAGGYRRIGEEPARARLGRVGTFLRGAKQWILVILRMLLCCARIIDGKKLRKSCNIVQFNVFELVLI